MMRKLKNFYHLLIAILANIVYRFPSKDLIVIGVTGTDGKTTTVHLINHILEEAGLASDSISSISAPGLHTTTPDPWILQGLLRKMVNKGIKYVVLEVTSHGLDQHRLAGTKFYLGVITNVTHEHLDYHQTYENYLKAKAKLFRGVKIAILNRDDKSYGYLSAKCKPSSRAQVEGAQSAKCVTYGIKNKQACFSGTRNKAEFTPENFKFKTKLPGEYNQYNCLAAIAATSALGLKPEIIRKAVTSFKGVEGRLEEINEGQDFKVIVDFAHTSNALENILKTLRSQITSHCSLITVFGCAGLRDVQKRPIMGEVATKYTDFIVLTAEDPRTEDVNEIIDQIAEGCKKAGGIESKTFFRISDRREAIRFAIQKLAKKGDVVVICGKGHEKSMCFGKTEYPWSDQNETREALRNLKKNV